jgi:hypothetical protein
MPETDTVNSTCNGNSQSLDTNHKGSKKPKKQRFLPPLPNFNSASEMHPATYSALVDKTPCEFASLENYAIFSMSADGSFPMMKISCSKAVKLSDGKPYSTGGGRVYRVSLSTH